MPLTITFLGILALIALISIVRLHAFLAFLAVSLGVGLALGLKPLAILDAIQKGIGGTLGSITAIIALGAMLGKLVAQSGAAQRIAVSIMSLVGTRHARWAFLVTGFIVGLPLFYSVGFMLLAPLVITVAYRYKLPALYIGLPMLASLVGHAGLPSPPPGPAGNSQTIQCRHGPDALLWHHRFHSGHSGFGGVVWIHPETLHDITQPRLHCARPARRPDALNHREFPDRSASHSADWRSTLAAHCLPAGSVEPASVALCGRARCEYVHCGIGG